MCICHGIASSPCFPCRLLCHLPRGLQPPVHFPYAPKRLSICVSVSETSFEKDGASAMFLFQVEWLRFPSIIQSHWVGSAMTTVTGLLVASPGLYQKGVQEARTGHFFNSFLHFVHCFRVYLWFFYLLILNKCLIIFIKYIFGGFIYILYNVELFNHLYTYSNFQLHFFNLT